MKAEDGWREVGLVFFNKIGKEGNTIGRDHRGAVIIPRRGAYVELGAVYLGTIDYKLKENGKKYGLFIPLAKVITVEGGANE